MNEEVFREYDVRGIVGIDPGKEFCASARRHKFDQRRLMAHAHAADAFDGRRRARFDQRGLDGAMDVAASLSDAT